MRADAQDQTGWRDRNRRVGNAAQITSIALLETANSFEYVLAIWFQARIGLPGLEIIEQIREIEWRRFACETNP